MTIEKITQVDQFLYYSLSEKRSNTRRYSAIHQDRQAMMYQSVSYQPWLVELGAAKRRRNELAR